jgi:hypothetical protein
LEEGAGVVKTGHCQFFITPTLDQNHVPLDDLL